MDANVESKVADNESAGAKYKNNRMLNVHRYSEEPCVNDAIKKLMELIEYKGYKQEKQCKILVLDLYHCYKVDKTRYIKFYLSPNSYDRIKRYNPFNVTYDIVKKLTTKLEEQGFIFVKKGNNNPDNGHTESSKMMALSKLVSFLEDDFGIKPSMIKTWKDKEVIILKEFTKKVRKNGRMVKIKPRKKYEDNNKIRKMRKAVNRYNRLLDNTYIDLDIDGYKYIRKIKKSDKNNQKKTCSTVFGFV